MKRALLFAACCLCAAFSMVRSSSAATCTGPGYHQYDFFVGNWAVKNKHGKRFATDRVTKEFKGCGIWERWYGGDGSRGAGYSGYVPARGVWVQSFVDDTGDVLVFEGKRSGRSIVFAGLSYPKKGPPEQNRVVFRPLPNGVVEEYWTISDDGGKMWKVAFDGFFHRV